MAKVTVGRVVFSAPPEVNQRPSMMNKEEMSCVWSHWFTTPSWDCARMRLVPLLREITHGSRTVPKKGAPLQTERHRFPLDGTGLGTVAASRPAVLVAARNVRAPCFCGNDTRIDLQLLLRFCTPSGNTGYPQG